MMADETEQTIPEAPVVEAIGPTPQPEPDAEIAKLKDDLLRALAEVENTRRRGERAAQDARTYAIDRFARELLPVADSLSRALAAMPEEQRAGADESVRTFIEGVAMTEKVLLEAFARHGVKPIGAKGEAFDPALHQAVAQIPSDAPAGAVAEVFQAGFKLGDRTLRAAMVAVSAGAPAESEPAQGVDIKV